MDGKYKENLKFFLVLILALLLRLVNLNQSFWLDEAISALIAQNPFPFQWTSITGDFQPPLYYLILHFFMGFNIINEWFLRIPSVVFAVLTVFVLYKLAASLFNQKTARVAALLLATSQFHIYYSQELRMYSLLGLLSLASFWAFYQRKWFWITVLNILGIYTSYIFFLIFVSQFTWLSLNKGNNFKIWWKWILSLAVTLFFFMPWIPNLFKQWDASRQLVAQLPNWKDLAALPFWKFPPQLFLKFSLGRINFENHILYGLIFLILTFIYICIFRNIRKDNDNKSLYLLNWIITPVFVGILISFFIPIDGVWRFIFLLPPFNLLVSVSLDKMKYSKFYITLLFSVNIFAILLYWINPKYQRENWRDAVYYMDRTDSPIIFTVENGFAPYQWYMKKNKLVCGSQTIDNCLKSQKTLFVPYLTDLFDGNRIIERKISQNKFYLTDVKNFPGVGFIYSYDKK